MPTSQPGASSTAISCVPRSSSTCCAVVGETCPKRLAEGAATGTAASVSMATATACAGQRTPTNPVPAETQSGSEAAALATRVSGPGQKAVASTSTMVAVALSASKSCSAMSGVGTCTMSGSVSGRPLTRKMSSTASSLSALAPSPYTVSVGKATSLPARSSSPARRRPAASGPSIVARTAGIASAVIARTPREQAAKRRERAIVPVGRARPARRVATLSFPL
mmetsp:Transcript_373/g.1068  ORF Transcript_373/g.1068 Transcript_373/m.1068 type:complete len:223 (-) Transcript_373:13-681(-)